MKYTASKDGVERCSIHVEMRLSRDDVNEYTAYAKRKGMSLKEWLQQGVYNITPYDLIKKQEEYES